MLSFHNQSAIKLTFFSKKRYSKPINHIYLIRFYPRIILPELKNAQILLNYVQYMLTTICGGGKI